MSCCNRRTHDESSLFLDRSISVRFSLRNQERKGCGEGEDQQSFMHVLAVFGESLVQIFDSAVREAVVAQIQAGQLRQLAQSPASAHNAR